MTAIQYDICDTQAMIYSYAAEQGYDMQQFSDFYMASDFCRREMDAEYSVMQLADDTVCWECIEPEIGPHLKKYPDGLCFDVDAAWWIGFTYRQLVFLTGRTSSEIVKKASFKQLISAYPGLHTVDEEMAGEILIEQLF